MKAERKQKLMIWAIIFLAVMNVSTILSIAYHNQRSESRNAFRSAGQDFQETEAEKFSGRFFRDQLNLNKNQMEAFRLINSPMRQKARAANIELDEMRKEMLSEMAKPTPDKEKLNALSDSVGALHSRLKKITYEYYFDLKRITDESQHKQLDAIFNEMFTSYVHAGPGYGNPQGRQRGKPFDN